MRIFFLLVLIFFSLPIFSYQTIRLEKMSAKRNLKFVLPDVSFVIFDIYSGKVLYFSHKNFLHHRIVPGSIFKIITSIYLLKNRSDLILNYQYFCKGRKRGVQNSCWKASGHGVENFSRALSNSCNLYFMSLSKKIKRKNFIYFYNQIKNGLLLNSFSSNLIKKDFSAVLSGLDFSIFISIEDLITIVRLISFQKTNSLRIENFRNTIPMINRAVLKTSLENVFVFGTASGQVKDNFFPENGKKLLQNFLKDNYCPWGKTSTMIDGINVPMRYGVFAGGYKNFGVIVLVKKGTGHIASRYALWLLKYFKLVDF